MSEDAKKKSIFDKDKLKKLGVYSAMTVVCLFVIYLIFADDKKTPETEMKGINTDVPLSSSDYMIDDKRKAYEFEMLLNKNESKNKSLEEFQTITGFKDLDEDSLEEVKITTPSQPESSISRSATTYKDLNRTLSSIGREDNNSEEVNKLKDEIAELKEQINENKQQKSVVDEQLEVLEKSLEMVSKYYPNHNSPVEMETNANKEVENNRNDKKTVIEVSKKKNSVVSSIPQHLTKEEILKQFSQERNIGFNTVSDYSETNRKTILACIDRDQTLENGQYINLRLLDDIVVNNNIIPKNSIITGISKINGERLLININSLEVNGDIIPVSLSAFDLTGQEGLYIPNNAELSASKEILANMGSNASTNIMVTSSASQQVASDLAKGAVSGVSQYFQKKIRQVRVNVKASDKVYLVSNN